MSGRLIYRVQARLGHYRPTTSSRTRYFAREVDAWRYAARVYATGGTALVAVAERGPWVVAGSEKVEFCSMQNVACTTNTTSEVAR